jgi:ADP-ribosyl-[dinitrogen reductase] hydrolase
MNKDRIRGMFYGLALGDALGAPFEFGGKNRLKNYTGLLDTPVVRFTRYQGKKTAEIGQITDDSEMTLTLANSLIRNKCYYKDDAITSYMDWANSNCSYMGTNTRELFKGVKTINGYKKRYAEKYGDGGDSVGKIFTDFEEICENFSQNPSNCNNSVGTWSQSNGCMMRCSPIALLPKDTYINSMIEDCKLSNPHPICVESCTVYIVLLRNLLEGKNKDDAITEAKKYVKTAVIKETIKQGLERQPRDIEDQKGWVLHALYCVFYCLSPLNTKTTFHDCVDEIIMLGGDTDTNACIAMATFGAYFSYEKMMLETRTKENIKILKACDAAKGDMKRPTEYTIKFFDQTIDDLIKIYA